MSHSTGCVSYTVLGITKFLNENVWASGTILLVAGLVIGMAGRKLFPHVIGSFAGLMAMMGVLIAGSIFGWLASTAGLIIMIILAIAAAGAVGWFIRQSIWIMVSFLGVFAGFFLGVFLTSTVIGMTGWESMTFLIVVCGITTISGAYASWKHGEWLVLLSTSFVGSYFFMRGWTFYFGHYPNEMTVYSGIASGVDVSEEYLEWQFWVYYLVFIGGFIGNYIW